MRNFVVISLISLMLIGQLAYSKDTDEKRTESEVSFIFDLLDNVDWPAEAVKQNPGIFVISVLGDSEFTAMINQHISKKSTESRKIEAREINLEDDFTSSQMIFVGENDLGTLAKILKKTENIPVLTISDIEGFAKYGVMVELHVNREKKEPKVEFSLNHMVAKKSGIKLGEKLLKRSRKTYGF